MEKGVVTEFGNGLEEFFEILSDWKENGRDNRETYHKLFQKVKQFDKHIAQRYDGVTGAHYANLLGVLFADKILSEEEIDQFSDEAREYIWRFKLLSEMD